MKKQPKFSYKFYVIVILFIGIISLQFWPTPKQTDGGNKGMSPAVSIVTVEPEKVIIKDRHTGRARALKEVEVRPKVGGTLLKKVYTEGQFVKEGTTLFEIDSEILKEQLNKAHAALELAKQSLERTKKLYKQRVASHSEYDKALSEYQQAEAAYRLANIKLSYAKVKAPVSGFAEASEYSEGNLVQANQSMLTKIYKTDQIYVDFSYSDKYVFAPYITKKIAFILEGEEVGPHEGSIDYISNTVDKATGIIKARGVIDNLDGKIKPGQFVTILLKGIEIEDAIVIPDRSIMQGPQGTFVYVVNKENKATIKPISLGALIEQGRIVRSGLSKGDKVITEGMIKVRPNQVVKVSNSKQTPRKTIGKL